jgi:hypothetical protein
VRIDPEDPEVPEEVADRSLSPRVGLEVLQSRRYGMSERTERNKGTAQVFYELMLNSIRLAADRTTHTSRA